MLPVQESGWGVASMARSAELLKYTWPGWPADLEARFVAWVSRLVLPQLNHEILERLPQANWQATVAGARVGGAAPARAGLQACARALAISTQNKHAAPLLALTVLPAPAECKAALAVLTGNRALWDNALSMWHRVFNAYIKPCGECGEVCGAACVHGQAACMLVGAQSTTLTLLLACLMLFCADVARPVPLPGAVALCSRRRLEAKTCNIVCCKLTARMPHYLHFAAVRPRRAGAACGDGLAAGAGPVLDRQQPPADGAGACATCAAACRAMHHASAGWW